MDPPPPPMHRNGVAYPVYPAAAASAAAVLPSVNGNSSEPFPGFAHSCVVNGKRYS
jgi:hypothetical protein